MKKGDLALSTSAIVALIVAIIVLGLIITFVVRGFGSLDSRLEAEASKLPDPARPTSAQPITISTSRTATIGDNFLAKISVYNSCPDSITVTANNVECTDTGGGTPVTLDQASPAAVVMSGQTATVTFIGTVATQPQRSICTVYGDDLGFLDGCDSFKEAKATIPVEFVE